MAGEEEVMGDREREERGGEKKEVEEEEQEVVVMDKASCVSKPRVVSEVVVVYGRKWRDFFPCTASRQGEMRK